MVDHSFYKQPTIPDFSIPESSIPPQPSAIGPYKIESLISKGGMSLLYLGLHPDTKMPLAIKILLPEFVKHPEMIANFLREAEIIGMTDHPNIVKLYGQGNWEGGLYIAMEFIQGISLTQFITQHSLSLRRSIEIILQTSYALCHLHTHGVIHRDLKPENILITEEGEVKVIDFGIAALLEEKDNKSQAVIGTPHYMSPEQKEDPLHVTFASDIYSLGIIAYELIAGRFSYGVVHLSQIPPGLKKILEKTLAVSREERYQDIVDLITDLTQYLKSGEWEKERPGGDQIKEVYETIQRVNQNLSPFSPPNWPQIEFGLVKSKGASPWSLYYDFFRFPNDQYGILIAEASSVSIEGAISIAGFRGMIKMYLEKYFGDMKATIRPNELAFALNQLAFKDSAKQQFGLSFLLLDPFQDKLSYISCGDGSLYHLPIDSLTPRKVASQNLSIGFDSAADFFETEDNWNIGDLLLLHSCEMDAPLEKILFASLMEYRNIATMRQAEAISKRLNFTSSPLLQKKAHALLTLQRIA